MNELRWDSTAKEWVAYATHRQERTFHPPPEYCPLCPTKSEDDFPTEVPRSSYEIVVFENKFPSFIPEPPKPEETGSELTPTAPGQGVCEVVLYTDDHKATLAEMNEKHSQEPRRRVGRPIRGAWLQGLREVRLHLREQG